MMNSATYPCCCLNQSTWGKYRKDDINVRRKTPFSWLDPNEIIKSKIPCFFRSIIIRIYKCVPIFITTPNPSALTQTHMLLEKLRCIHISFCYLNEITILQMISSIKNLIQDRMLFIGWSSVSYSRKLLSHMWLYKPKHYFCNWLDMSLYKWP